MINFPLTTGTYGHIISQIINWAAAKKPAMVCVANVHMFIEAQQQADFLKLVQNADMVTPDGKPLCWALHLLYGIKQDRVAGMDLLPDILQEMEKQNLSVYFYGGSQQMLDGTKSYIEKKHPSLRIAGMYSPPFRPLTNEENELSIEHINQTAPNVVFVVLGCPKQERWMAMAQGRLKAVAVGVGGALPVMMGLQKRAPRWMQNAGLEWLFRLFQEPKRLFKRYAYTNSSFLYCIAKEFIKLKLFKRK